MSRTVGLYIHIPFCQSKCGYCDFYSLPIQEEAVWDAYLKALTKHLRETAGPLSQHSVDSVYFGGGTPSLLGAKRLRSLVDVVGKYFQLAQNAEITLEGNPDSLDEKDLKKIRRSGFNRLSIGAQSFDDNMLRLLGRAHNAAQITEAISAARAAGFYDLSVDLLFGLPGQTLEHWAETLRAGLALEPEHISCYSLSLEKNTPLYESTYTFPDDDVQADMFLCAADMLYAAGYHHYEISNYCRPGYECRHNLKYWTLQPYIGLGPGAHSDFGGRRWSYPRELDLYIAGINAGDALTSHLEDIPLMERAGEYLMLRLRTARGVSGNEYARTFRVSFEAVERRLEEQRMRGLALREGDHWRLTEQGFLLSNRVIGEVLEVM